MFLLQLESPKSEHRNSSYVRNNPDYSMIKTEAEFDLTLDVWFSLKSSLIIHLNHSNRIRNEQVMAKIRTLVKIE